MAIQIVIPEDELAGLNSHARHRLQGVISDFANDVIAEANRIESGQNMTQAPPQVTSSMVDHAATFVRRGLSSPKPRLGWKILRVIGAVLSLFVGITYDRTKQDPTGFLPLIILIGAAILCVTISTL